MTNGVVKAPVRDSHSTFPDVTTQRQQNIARMEREQVPFRKAAAAYESVGTKIRNLQGENSAETSVIKEVADKVKRAQEGAQQAVDDLSAQIALIKMAMESGALGGKQRPTAVLHQNPPDVQEALRELAANDEAIAAAAPARPKAFTGLYDLENELDEDESQKK